MPQICENFFLWVRLGFGQAGMPNIEQAMVGVIRRESPPEHWDNSMAICTLSLC